MPDNGYNTYFKDASGKHLGDMLGILNVTLYEGMPIEFLQGEKHKVVTWAFCSNHHNPETGLTITVELE